MLHHFTVKVKEGGNMSDYGKRVKVALISQDRSQVWLIERVAEKTGLYFDSAYLSRVLNGKNKNPKIIGAINEILGIS